MAAGRHAGNAPRRRRKGSRMPILIALILLITLSVGGTLAYIVTSTANVQNQFVPSSVSCAVSNDSTVQNTGDVDALIRATYAVNWVAEGGASVRAVPPAVGTDYRININSDWTLQPDGFYYYSSSVAPGDATRGLLTVTPGGSAPEGYSLAVEVVAEAIQADGDTDPDSVVGLPEGTPAHSNAWGY